MTREDRLDELLDTLRPAAPWRYYTPPTAQWPESDPELDALIETARELAPLTGARPEPEFATTLRARLLARAAERRADMVALGTLPLVEPGRNGARTIPIGPAAEPAMARVSRWSSPRVALVAAALLLMLGAAGWGVAWAATTALPGNPFYGLHQLEQTVQVNTAPDSASRAQLHLTYARQLLANLRPAAQQQTGGATYGSTLADFLQEMSAAAQQISLVPAGTQQTTLEQSLAALRTDARATLLAVLPGLTWPDQVTTTGVLGSLGVSVPRITGAIVVPADRGLWTLTLSGSGFESGATLRIDGHPGGTITALTATSLTAQIPPGLVRSGDTTLGLSNPDGTAATTTTMTTIQPVTTPEPTPGDNGHGGGGGGGNGGGTVHQHDHAP